MSNDETSHPEITLALPTYNERENIVNVLEASIRSLDQLGRSWEILVIDNFSRDGTPQVVRDFAESSLRPIRLICHDENRLYSGSCRTAIENARGTYIAIMDSDGQFVASDLPKFLEKLSQGANLVFGWRRERHDPVFRKVISLVFNLLGKFWLHFSFHDLNCGIRMFDRQFAATAAINYKINMSNPELYVRACNAGLKMDECEVQHCERTKGNTSHDLLRLWRIFCEVSEYMRNLRQELRTPCT